MQISNGDPNGDTGGALMTYDKYGYYYDDYDDYYDDERPRRRATGKDDIEPRMSKMMKVLTIVAASIFVMMWRSCRR